jgi:hypothetical protein
VDTRLILKKIIVTPLLRPQSADRKTLAGLLRAEMHIFAQVIFKNIIILGIKI